MSDARLTNTAVLGDFRVALATFAHEVRLALTDLELEARKATEWVSHNRAVHWKGEVRRSGDAVAQAKDELANSRTFKRIDDYVPSCVEEKKTLERAKRRLEHAEGKVEAVKHWSRVTQRAVEEFRGPLTQLMAMLDGDIPRAMALLERMSAALARYAAINAPQAIKWEDIAGEQQSMSRPAEDSPDENEENEPRRHEE